jgi:hypothetical protein
MIVTDAVEPLSDQLKQNADKNLTLWGLYKIAVRIFGIAVERMNRFANRNVML